MQNGSLSVTATANAITAALKTQAGADPSPGSPVTVDFLDRAGGYRTVGITAPLSATIPQGVSGGFPNLMPCRGWWHLVDGPSPQIGFACYTGPNGMVKPIDGDLVTTLAPGNAPFTVYTPTPVANASARIIGCSPFEGGIPVAGQWIAPTYTKLWQPGMPLPLDVLKTVQNGPVNQFQLNPNPNQWYDTSLAVSILPGSPADAISVEWCGDGLTSVSNQQITAAAYRNGGVHGTGTFGISYSEQGEVVMPLSGEWFDFPGLPGVITYTIKIMGNGVPAGAGAISFPYGANVNDANGQPLLRATTVMT